MARGAGRRHDDVMHAFAAAACDVIATEGIHALTVRRVAAAAGTSLGRLQHYFADRAALLRAAFDMIQQDVADEVGLALHASSSPQDIVRAVLVALIPVDAAARRRMRIMTQFESLALSDATIAEELRAGHARLHELIAGLVATCAPSSATPYASDTAQRLLALAEGLGGQVLQGHEVPERAQRVLVGSIDDAFDRKIYEP